MKKQLILLLAIILIPYVLAETIEQGQSQTIGGKEVTLISIQESKILVSVDGQKTIIGLNERKTINGIEIIVTEIFYSGELSKASIDTKLTYSCGDKVCSSYESSETCCSDCGCSGSQKCSENSCISPECLTDENCSDSNQLTEDYCSNYVCKHKEIGCSSNSECNDNNPDTDDVCSKGSCQNLPPICKTDEDCKDTNPCTIEKCINKDCQYEQIQDCEEKKEMKTEKQEIKVINEDSSQNFIKKFFNWIKNIFS